MGGMNVFYMHSHGVYRNVLGRESLLVIIHPESRSIYLALIRGEYLQRDIDWANYPLVLVSYAVY